MSLRFLLRLKVTSSVWVVSRGGLTFWSRNLDCTIPCEMCEWAGWKVTIEGVVTTVPLSVCYGALNLLVRVDTSNFVPYACDWAVTGEYEGPESTVPSSAISGGSLAAERSYCTSGTLAPVFFRFWASLGAEVLRLLYSLSLYNHPGSLISMPLISSPVPSFVPQVKKSARCCLFESLSDSCFIAQNMAFYWPYKA